MAKCYLKKGEWRNAGITLKRLSATLFPLAKVKLMEDGQYILDTLKGHIDSQDLPWQSLSESTIRQKQGSTKIYEDTGELKNGFVVRRLKDGPRGSTIFIGASPWKTHKGSGLKYSELMVFLEYGTSKIPPRPLIRPTIAEVEPMLKDNFPKFIESILNK